MDEETNKLIREQFNSLPKELQQTINTFPWEMHIKAIGKSNNLSVEQLVSLKQETMFVLYGFEPADAYPDNLAKALGITDDKAMDIAEQVLEQIFNKVSAQVEKTTGQTKPSDTHPAPPLSPLKTPFSSMDKSAQTAPNPTQTIAPPAQIKQPQQETVAKKPEQSIEIAPEIHPVPSRQGGSYGTSPSSQQTGYGASPVESKAKDEVSLPDYRYPDGNDPYREPIK